MLWIQHSIGTAVHRADGLHGRMDQNGFLPGQAHICLLYTSKVIFVHDFFSKAEIEAYREQTNVNTYVIVQMCIRDRPGVRLASTLVWQRVGSVPRGPAAPLVTMVMRGCPRALLTLQRVTVPGTGLPGSYTHLTAA